MSHTLLCARNKYVFSLCDRFANAANENECRSMISSITLFHQQDILCEMFYIDRNLSFAYSIISYTSCRI